MKRLSSIASLVVLSLLLLITPAIAQGPVKAPPSGSTPTPVAITPQPGSGIGSFLMTPGANAAQSTQEVVLSTPTPIPQADNSMTYNFTVTLPNDWLVWNNDSYETRDTALNELGNMLRNISSSLSLDFFAADELDYLQIAGFDPQLENGQLVSFRFLVGSYVNIVQEMGFDANITPDQLIDQLAATRITVNNRSTGVFFDQGTALTLWAVMPWWNNVLGVAVIQAPRSYWDQNSNLLFDIATSLRDGDEEIDPSVALQLPNLPPVLPQSNPSNNQSLDYTLDPNFGSGSISTTTPNLQVRVVSGGNIDIQGLLGSQCAGFASAPPDYRVMVQANFTFISFAFLADDNNADTTMVINDPHGDWWCSDDIGNIYPANPLNPGMDLNATLGQYDIWVGSYNADEFVEGTLHVFTQ